MDALEKINDYTNALLDMVPDADKQQASDYIAKIISTQAQSDIEEVEVIVPTKSVLRRVDIGHCCLMSTTQGVLFQAKGSLSTLISPRQKELCASLVAIMDAIEGKLEDAYTPEDKEAISSFAQAWIYVLESPIFCQLSPAAVFETASVMLKTFNEAIKQGVDEATTREDTLEDANLNADFEARQEVFTQLDSESKTDEIAE